MNNNGIQIESFFECFMVMISRQMDKAEREKLISFARYLTSHIN